MAERDRKKDEPGDRSKLPDRSRSGKMYDKSPKIASAPEEGDTVRSRGGAPKEAAAEAKRAEKADRTEGTTDQGGTAKGDVMAGTESIPTEHHELERDHADMHHRHMMEHSDMHHRHAREHLLRTMGRGGESMEAMHDRHHSERRAMHTKHEGELRGMHDRHMNMGEAGGERKDKGEGLTGTQP